MKYYVVFHEKSINTLLICNKGVPRQRCQNKNHPDTIKEENNKTSILNQNQNQKSGLLRRRKNFWPAKFRAGSEEDK